MWRYQTLPAGYCILREQESASPESSSLVRAVWGRQQMPDAVRWLVRSVQKMRSRHRYCLRQSPQGGLQSVVPSACYVRSSQPPCYGSFLCSPERESQLKPATHPGCQFCPAWTETPITQIPDAPPVQLLVRSRFFQVFCMGFCRMAARRVATVQKWQWGALWAGSAEVNISMLQGVENCRIILRRPVPETAAIRCPSGANTQFCEVFSASRDGNQMMTRRICRFAFDFRSSECFFFPFSAQLSTSHPVCRCPVRLNQHNPIPMHPWDWWMSRRRRCSATDR